MNLNQIQKLVNKQIEKNSEFFNNVDFIVGMSRGGLMPAVLVATKLNKPLVTIYIDKQDNIFFDRTEWIKDKKVLIVDDIIRSGSTMTLATNHLLQYLPKENLFVFTLFSLKQLSDYPFNIMSIPVENDVTFPWDYDRQ